MIVKRKDFSGQVTPSIIAVEYHRCKFNHPMPIDVNGKKRGVRLFPDDDTPRIFIKCGMVNAEPPPGSTVIDCLTCVKEYAKITSVDTITIDDVSEDIDHHSNFVYGKFDPETGGYEDFSIPDEQVID